MNRTVIIIGLVIIGIVGSGIWVRTRTHSTAGTATADQPSSTATVSYHGEAGKTALELLQQHAAVQTTTDQALGEFVSSINGVTAGTSGTYWVYYVNGTPMSTNPGRYVTSSTETIEWKLE